MDLLPLLVCELDGILYSVGLDEGLCLRDACDGKKGFYCVWPENEEVGAWKCKKIRHFLEQFMGMRMRKVLYGISDDGNSTSSHHTHSVMSTWLPCHSDSVAKSREFSGSTVC